MINVFPSSLVLEHLKSFFKLLPLTKIKVFNLVYVYTRLGNLKNVTKNMLLY